MNTFSKKYFSLATLLIFASLVVDAERIHVPGCPSLFDVDLSNTSVSIKDVSKCYCDNASDSSNTLVQVNCLYSSRLSDLTAALKSVVNAKKEVFSIYLQEFDFSATSIDIPDEYFSKLSVSPKELIIVNCLNTNLLLLPKDVFKGIEDTLTILKIDRCKLVDVPAAISNLKNLESLVLKSTDISKLKKDDLRNLVNLKSLELSGNSMNIEKGSFDKLSSLESLKLSNNANLNSSLFEEISPVTTLTSLDLSGNNIKDIDNKPFSKLKDLRVLNLNLNYLNSVSSSAFDGLSKLVSLDLRVNLITNIVDGAFDPLKSLNELQLAGNYLNDINPKVFSFSNLTKLDLSYNEIATLKQDSFKNCGGLRKLNLDKNEKLASINSGAFNGLKNLKYLNLSFTNLNTFDGDIFKPTTGLFLLDLSGNKISSLTGKQFVNLKNLSILIIKSTQLTTFPDEIFNVTKSLKRIEASNNKWVCDKKIKGLVKFLQSRESNRRIAEKFRSADVAKCALPADFRDLPLVALNLDKKTVK